MEFPVDAELQAKLAKALMADVDLGKRAASLREASDPEKLQSLIAAVPILQKQVEELDAAALALEEAFGRKTEATVLNLRLEEKYRDLLMNPETARLAEELAELEAELEPFERMEHLEKDNADLRQKCAALEARLQGQLAAAERRGMTAAAKITQQAAEIAALKQRVFEAEEALARELEAKTAQDALLEKLVAAELGLQERIKFLEAEIVTLAEKHEASQKKLDLVQDPSKGHYTQGFEAGKAATQGAVEAMQAQLAAVMAHRGPAVVFAPPPVRAPYPYPPYGLVWRPGF
jgi:hypothetical protein